MGKGAARARFGVGAVRFRKGGHVSVEFPCSSNPRSLLSLQAPFSLHVLFPPLSSLTGPLHLDLEKTYLHKHIPARIEIQCAKKRTCLAVPIALSPTASEDGPLRIKVATDAACVLGIAGRQQHGDGEVAGRGRQLAVALLVEFEGWRLGLVGVELGDAGGGLFGGEGREGEGERGEREEAEETHCCCDMAEEKEKWWEGG